MEKNKVIMGLIVAFFLATSTLGLVISSGSAKPKTFVYQGLCDGEVNEVVGTYWLVYTLKNLNIGGVREGPYIRVPPKPDVERVVVENNLLYWKNAVINVDVNGATYPIRGFVLGNHSPGDKVVLDCYFEVVNGRIVRSNAIEIPV